MGKKYDCDQKKCGYLIMGMGCQACDDCGTEPFILDDVCPTCWNCSKDEGLLRWDNESNNLSEDDSIKNEEIKQELKPMEIKTK